MLTTLRRTGSGKGWLPDCLQDLGVLGVVRVEYVWPGIFLDLAEDVRRSVAILEARSVGQALAVWVAALREVDPVGRHLVGHPAIALRLHRQLRRADVGDHARRPEIVEHVDDLS